MRMTGDRAVAAESVPGLWRRLMFRALNHIQDGYLVIEENGETWGFGDPASDCRATVEIRDPAVYKEFVLGGGIGAAEAYVLKLWDSHDLTRVVQVFARNLKTLERKGPLSAMRRLMSLLDHRFNRNTINQARENISSHYDLGNELFERFLDASMMYSSAMYPSPEATLEDAQTFRLHRICQKLDLKPGDHLLEIGTGWGGMAEFAARHYGCRVTTTTISSEQFNYAQERIREAGLEDRVTLLMQDYRKLDGQYDKIVSLEMIEAVGHEYLSTYFAKCNDLLRPEGAMLLQAITIADQRYDYYRKHVDFIQKYIFPGGHLPSVARITQEVSRVTDMTVRHLEDFGDHYARTLRDWQTRFNRSSEQLMAQGYDETFQRLWQYYFAYCEGGFRECNIGVAQLILSKPQNRRSSILP
ncbi:MAG: cyclopropane-fatty-acyl-phospholipid synthase family protein [Natronospirillum sp.]|uniref:SAM-dependent methyltransferase n=1 Tax=Natronospirillum sp. TaxID=2812955 RepID=UPI0025E674BD|nr:cyclopropane-fatty-acyl-phospholipid synthase family protein [Natronospirillum sp.]MCH8550601.1 cyclopropane-fatty-acyl-phospholipid synthase family protein [Natronospirillum sp.]